MCITDRTSCAACCETHRPHGWRCARCICTKRRWTMNGWVRSVRSDQCTASRTRKLIRCTSDCCNMHRSGLHRVRCCLWLVDHVKAYSPLLQARIGCPSAGLGYRLCIQARPSPSAPAFCPSFPCLPSHRRCFRAAASAGRHVWLRAPGVRAMRVIQPEKLAVARAETFGRRGFAAANRATA